MRGTICLLAAAAFATAAHATDLSVSVRASNGRAVPNAVITLYPSVSGDAPRFDWPYRMAQQNLQFDPFVLIVPVGAVVAFPNRDAVRHQVYSFSPTHPFELKLYGKDETRTVRFDKAGVVALGCNIHDGMVAFIKVVDTPFAAKSDASGVAALRGAPGGGAILHVWQPYLKAPNNEIVRSIVLPRDGAARETLLVDLRTPPDHRADY
jgi:plastocyanin